MDKKERARRECDFISTLPPLVQSRIEEQRRTQQNDARRGDILPERYIFSRRFF